MSKRTSKAEKKRALRSRVLTPNLVATSAVLALSASGVASAQDPGSYFKDVTATAFPTPACADPDLLESGTKLGCYTSWMILSDFDTDGDLDLMFANGGGYYVPGNAEPSTVYLNDGTGAFRDVTDTMFGNATSRLRQVSLGDIDGDGDLDLFQPGGYGLDEDKLWIQTSPGVFDERSALKLPGRMSSRAGASHFGDLDGDGDLDLVIADWGTIPYNRTPANQSKGNVWVYLNDGLGNFSQLPSFTVPSPMEQAEGRTPIDIDLADIDGDFDLDILVNNRNGQSRIFLNDGAAFFTDGTYDASKYDPEKTAAEQDPAWRHYPNKKGPYAYNQELCDIDGDGDLDMLIDNSGGRRGVATSQNTTQLLINDGAGHFEDLTHDLIFGEPGADDNAAKCADVNGDGFYDIVVASLGRNGEKLMINDGTGQFNFVTGGFPVISDPSLGIDIADLNGDGILDVVTGQGEGSNQVDRIYYGSGESKRDVTPPKFRAIEEPVAVPGEPIVIRFAPIDAHTSETGEHVKSVTLTYKVNGGASVSAKPVFIGGDLFRAVIPAQPNGTVLTISPVAVDRQNLVSADASFEILVGTEVVPVEPGNGDGDGDVDGDGDGDGDVVGDGDGDVGGGDGDGDGEEPSGDGDGDDDKEPVAGGDGDDETPVKSTSSDGCSVGGAGASSNGLAMLGLLGLLLGRAFRRSRKAD